jgi:hypothetical protein
MDSMAYHAVTENGSRRFGASQPMRITASWFGSLDPPHTRLWRDRSALERELPSNRLLADLAPTAFDGAAVLGTVKAQALRVVAEEATSLDSSCARRLATVAGRDEETGFQIEQRNDGRKMGCAS